MRSGGGCEVSRGVRGAGTPAKANFGSVSGGGGRGGSRKEGGAVGRGVARSAGSGARACAAARGGARGRGGRPPPAKSPCFPVYFHKIQTKCVKLVIFHKKNCENSVKKANAFYLHFRRPERILKLTSRDPIGKKKGGSCDES